MGLLSVGMMVCYCILTLFVIYYIVVKVTDEIPYYMIDYVVYPQETMRTLFMVSVLTGGMGAIMDVANILTIR